MQDKDGGVVPGATVVVKNNATGVSQTAVTNASGAYSVPSLEPGTYTVTITLPGVQDVLSTTSACSRRRPRTLQTKLEVGAAQETVDVVGGTRPRAHGDADGQLDGQRRLHQQPAARRSRNALNFLIFLPGVQTHWRRGQRAASTISGLPQNTINITIDGISNSNLLQSGDGFFSMVVPRLDAVEEVTLTTATAGADAAARARCRFAS